MLQPIIQLKSLDKNKRNKKKKKCLLPMALHKIFLKLLDLLRSQGNIRRKKIFGLLLQSMNIWYFPCLSFDILLRRSIILLGWQHFLLFVQINFFFIFCSMLKKAAKKPLVVRSLWPLSPTPPLLLVVRPLRKALFGGFSYSMKNF